MSKAILFDGTLCIGCKQCEEGCAKANGLPYDDKIAAESKQSAHKYTAVLSKNDEKFMRRLCMHCGDPTCVSVCPVGALIKTSAGPVYYEGDRCMGCRYCMMACPFGVPKYEWEKPLPLVRKCIMCRERVETGKSTACAEACPTGATKFGNRDELLVEARQRLKDNPKNYVNHIYGEYEAGGTSVLLLSGVPFEDFGYSLNINTEPYPILTFRVLSRIPDIVGLAGALLGGIWWITHRRAEVAAAEGGDQPISKTNKETR